MTEIWYIGRLLYDYFDFNIYKSEVLQINWNLVAAGVHYCMLITNLMFIISKLFSFIFFGLIWSQNLKFFKLIEIWYIGRSLYAYFDFIAYFFKFFVIHIRSGKVGPKIWSYSNLLKLGAEGDYHMLISTLMFIFSKLFSFIFLGKISSQNLTFVRLTEIWYRGRLPYGYFDFNVYFFNILFIHIFGENLVPKSEVLQIDWNLVQR